VWGFTGTIFFPSSVFAIIVAFCPLYQLGRGTTYRENKKTLKFGFSHPSKSGGAYFPNGSFPLIFSIPKHKVSNTS